MPAVDVASLTKRYGDLTAVDELTFSVRRGTVTAILGPNGAGKTTTVECCVGFRRPDTGSVLLLGNDPVRAGPAEHARVGVMLQEAAGFTPPPFRENCCGICAGSSPTHFMPTS